jgi:uncharacterized protein YegL
MFWRICSLAAWLAVAAPAAAGVNVVVVLDDSGSMRERLRSNRRVTKITAAKQALLTVLDELPADAQVGVVALNTRRGDWTIPLGTVNKSRLRQSLSRIRAGGGTPLGETMKIAADALLELRESQRYGAYKLLIVTDGEAGDPELVERYLPEILSRGLTVDVVGVDMARDHSLATKVHTYRRADDPQSLARAIQEVFAESSQDQGAEPADFELLASFPPEFAKAALQALGETGNHPIGEAPPSEQLAAAEGAPGGAQVPGRLRTPIRPPRGRVTVGLLGGFCGMVCVSILFFLVLFAVLARRR